jgi:triosephosphate isomerase
MARRKLIAANWKMNKTIAEAELFAKELKNSLSGLPGCDLAVYPPFFALPAAAAILRDTPVAVGAQDVYWEASGAFTGEISCDMVRDAGGVHVLIGHSERRHVLCETNDVVAMKFRAVIDNGLTAVLCVGEKIEQREAGKEGDIVREQLATALAGVGRASLARVVVAYEPVWAIGTGKTATPDDAKVMHEFIRAWLSEQFDAEIADATRILYGGSVKPGNAAELLAKVDIDGALIGGASLELDSYLSIARATA